jgi:hypothetical protein
MAENGFNKPPSIPSKSFMTAGPSLHYSHTNIHLCWSLSIAVYLAAAFIWSRLLIGEDLSVSLMGLFYPEFWNIGRFVAVPLSIYEYPWQIVVLGVLMGILATLPVLISQLLSFRYSIPMIIIVVIVSRLGLFGVFLMASCLAIACRPLRFRSRFISIALCITPQVIYWAIWGGYQSIDPIRWGFSYAPWVYAWLTGLFMAAVILAIGHFNRYKPGVVWTAGLLLLLLACGIFYYKIGFAELDYQLYVAGSSPEETVEFHDHSLAPILDEIIRDDPTRSWLQGIFYPAEPLQLREKLKSDIQNQLVYGNWPQWIQKKLPPQFLYQTKRLNLLRQYERFIDRWPKSDRMPIALYNKALANEMHPDIRRFGHTETLHFYSDYPYYENILIWQKLYEDFPASPEALEARWRIAMQEAGRGKFDKAEELCDVAVSLTSEAIKKLENSDITPNTGIFSAFTQPPKTAMTATRLRDVAFRLRKLRALISRENQGTTPQSKQRLAEFVMLNPYRLDYDAKLTTLLAGMEASDPLRNYIRLALALIQPDPAVRLQKLAELTTSAPPACDAAIHTQYEIALIKIGIWKNLQTSPDAKKAALNESRAILTQLTTQHGETLWADQAKTLLASLPEGE